MELVTITSEQIEEALNDISTTNSNARAQIEGEVVRPEEGEISLEDAQSSDLINLDDFRADSRFAGINGSGFSTVIIDSGIDRNHPFFGPDSDRNGVADRIVYQYDFADNDANAEDVSGHGSNVASIAASSDSTYRGIAPGSNIIALKVFTDLGGGGFRDIEEALQWVVANAATYNIASINMSLSDAQNHSSPQRLYGISDELQALKNLGIITVSASGNRFITFSSQQGVGYPAADPNSISVGAVFDSSFGRVSYSSGATANTTGADRLTPFSQRHSSLSTIFAPGAPITGAGRNGTTATYHGTSQATPHIAGIATLMQDLAMEVLGRRLSVDEFTNLLRSTGVGINDGDDEDDNVANTGLNFKRVDVQALGQAILAMAPNSINIDHALAASVSRVTEGDTDTRQLTYTITRSGTVSAASSLQYSFSGDAINGTDYNLVSITGDNVEVVGNTINFAPGATRATVTVDVAGDLIDEINERISLNLSNAISSGSATISGSPTVVTITDNDTTSISINDVSWQEGNAGTSNVELVVSLSNPNSRVVKVNYATADETATVLDNDYATASGTLTFNPGETSKTISLQVNGDTTFESDETLLVNLSSPTNSIIADATGVVTITNDETEANVNTPANYSLAASTTILPEADSGTVPITFTITRSQNTLIASSVRYSLSGQATLGRDYRVVGVSGTGVSLARNTIQFAEGATVATLSLDVLGDTMRESHEAITVSLSNPTPITGTITDSPVSTLILDNDPIPTISVNNVRILEGNDGSATARLNVTLSNTSADVITVNYATVDGTATTADNDYVSTSGSLTFNPGQRSKVVTVPINGDTFFEGNETFSFNLTDAVNTANLTANASITITNDDRNIIGTDNADVLTGTINNETLQGNGGADTLTGGGGIDQFIYNSASDAGDVITDFRATQDKIVISSLLANIGYVGTNPLADGVIQFVGQDSNTMLLLDTDGSAGINPALDFILIQNVSITAMNNLSNFVL